MVVVDQGSILKIEGKKGLFFVISNRKFNESELVVVCPIATAIEKSATHVPITENVEYLVVCEQVVTFDST